MVLPGVAFMIVFNYIQFMELSLLLKIIRLLTRFLLHHGLDLKIFESLWKIVFWEAVRNTLAISLMKLF